MDFSRFKALNFDVVGTIIDFEGGMTAYLRGLPGVADLSRDLLLDTYRQHRGDGPAGWFPDDLVRVFGRMAIELGLPETPTAAEGFRRPSPTARPFRICRGARAAAPPLQARGHDQRPALFAHLMYRTLGHPFDDALAVDDSRHEKPDPIYFGWCAGS